MRINNWDVFGKQGGTVNQTFTRAIRIWISLFREGEWPKLYYVKRKPPKYRIL